MPESSRTDIVDRAMGTLVAGALGDALGMPTQLLSADEIRATYGFVDRFVAPTPDHPVSRGLLPGTITDDTEQTLLLGRALVESGPAFDHRRWVNALLDWERDVKARGSYDLLGPSTKRALDAINNGVEPEEAGRSGETNGAAMRIAPVGIAVPPKPLGALVAKVAETCRATHNTSIAIAAAAAVATTVSCGISGATWQEAAGKAVEAARNGAALGRWVTGGSIAARIDWARQLVRGKSRDEAIRLIVDLVGTGVVSQESVPAAFAVLEISQGDPWQAAVIGANLGGDTDTIGAIAAGMAGACVGFSALPRDRVEELKGLDLNGVKELVEALVSMRLKQAGETGT